MAQPPQTTRRPAGAAFLAIPLLAVLVLAGVAENLGYRQATAWWRARAFWDYWRGDLGWGRMERRGIAGTTGARRSATPPP
ncbi:MAG TPA: hypothetical protein VHM23_00075 [Actinomycetota bacterium]|nr:hypothetical protein [Actinomycetota bacterium]